MVDICTKDSLRELATPGLLAIFAPITIGFAFGAGPLAGYLAGAIAAGVLMAVFLANSGGAWDNAKKMVEDGLHGGKGSEAHAATVIGDTVGDPFKDTAGPSINPLIKVMNLVAVLIAPAVIEFSTGTDKNNGVRAIIAIIAFAIIAAAVIVSKRRKTSMGDEPAATPSHANACRLRSPTSDSCPCVARRSPRDTRTSRLREEAAMTQFSLFGAAAATPVLEDLGGVLLAGGHWVRTGGTRGSRSWWPTAGGPTRWPRSSRSGPSPATSSSRRRGGAREPRSRPPCCRTRTAGTAAPSRARRRASS